MDLIYNERVWDGDGDDTAVIDMGAYEFGSVPVYIKPSVVVNNKLPIIQYPNPVAHSATFEFVAENDSRVSLVLFNYQGQYLNTLVNNTLPSGKHSITWNTDGLPSGIYFYRLTTGSRSFTGKMVVVK